MVEYKVIVILTFLAFILCTIRTIGELFEGVLAIYLLNYFIRSDSITNFNIAVILSFGLCLFIYSLLKIIYAKTNSGNKQIENKHLFFNLILIAPLFQILILTLFLY
jgi:hypothetical protein